MRLTIPILAALCLATSALADGARLLKGLKPEEAKPPVPTGFRPKLQQLKVELGLLSYHCLDGVQKTNKDAVVTPLFKSTMGKMVGCIEGEQRKPNSEEYEKCLQASFAELYSFLFVSAYANANARLCPEIPPPGPPPPNPGAEPAAKVDEAIAYLRDGQGDKAEPLLDAAISHFSRQVGPRTDRYVCATTNEDLAKVIAENPDRKGAYPIHAAYCEALHAKAQIVGRRKDYEAALALLEKEAPLRPGNTEVLVARGETLTQLGRHRDSAHLFEKALRTVPASDSFTRSRVMLGFAAAQVGMGNLTAARKATEESIRLDPANPTAKDELHYIETLEQQRRALQAPKK